MHHLLYYVCYKLQWSPCAAGLAGTFLLTVLPTLSRLNHDCAPNCGITYRLAAPPGPAVHPPPAAVVALLMPLRDILPLEELTISYLAQECQPYASRQAFLQQAFAFTCACRRCTREAPHSSSSRAKTGDEALMAQYIERLSSNDTAAVASVDAAAATQLADRLCVFAPPLLPYDSAHLALLLLEQLRSIGAAGEGVAAQMRAVEVLGRAFSLAGCGGSAERAEYLVYGASLGLRLIDAGGGVDAGVIELGGRQCTEAMAVLRCYYVPKQCGGDHDEVARRHSNPYLILYAKVHILLINSYHPPAVRFHYA